MRPDHCPLCSGEMLGLEYDHSSSFRYDGVSEWVCMNCGYRQGRFCGKEISGNEFEKPFCDGPSFHPHKMKIVDGHKKA